MKKINKILSVALIGIMLFGINSCDKNDDGSIITQFDGDYKGTWWVSSGDTYDGVWEGAIKNGKLVGTSSSDNGKKFEALGSIDKDGNITFGVSETNATFKGKIVLKI